MAELEWVISQGGPLLVVSGHCAARWRGLLPPIEADVPPGWRWGDDDSVICDYDRACDHLDDQVTVDDSLPAWTVGVGDDRALVLEGETATAAVRVGDDLVILRNAEVATEEDAVQLVEAVAGADWHGSAHALAVAGGRLFIFDAAAEGAGEAAGIDAEGGVLDIEVPAGIYHVAYAAPRPPGDRLTLIRLRRAVDRGA